MRPLLAASLLLLAAPAFANPMLDKCLPFAPAECALTETTASETFLACFAPIKLDTTQKPQAVCAEELAHARVHKACAADLPKFCAKVKKGGNRTMDCLRKNIDFLEPACGKALKGYEGIVAPNGGERKRKRGAGGVSAVRC